MMTMVKEIEWEESAEAIPAFLTMVIMPVSFSITDGMAFGFIAYSIINLSLGRKKKKLPLLMYLLSLGFVLRYAFL